MATGSSIGADTATTPPSRGSDAPPPAAPDPAAPPAASLAEPVVLVEADAKLADEQFQTGETPLAADAGPPGAGSLFENIKSWVKPLAWAAAAGLLFLAFVFGIIRPQDGTSDPVGHNAALAWNGAIQRLGIQPLYPPKEEF